VGERVGKNVAVPSGKDGRHACLGQDGIEQFGMFAMEVDIALFRL